MTSPLDVEYVELRARGEDDAARDIQKALLKMAADIKAAAKDFEKTINGSFNKIENEARDAGDTIAADIISGVKLAKNSIDDLADDAKRDFNRIERDAAKAGVTIAASIAAGSAVGGIGGDVDRRGGFFSGVARLFRGAGSALTGLLSSVSRLFVKVGEDGTRSLTRLGQGISKVTNLLGGMFSSVANFAGANPLLTLLIALAPAIFAVVGALGQLSGLLLLLPGAIGGLVAVIAPLIIAFQGFGDAVSAIASGDLEKINEAMKNLAPAAREVAKDVAALKKPFDDLKKSVQQAFFAPLTDVLDRFGTTVLPSLARGLSQVAGSLGRFVRDILELVGEQDILEAIGDLFASVARSLDRIRPSAVKLIGVLFGVMEHSLPFLERIGTAFGRAMDGLSNFLSESMQTGDFDRFLEDAFRVTKELIDLFLAFGGYLKTIFGAGAGEGESFLVTLTNIFNKLNEFFKSEEGQKALRTFYELVPLIGKAFELLAEGLILFAGIITGIADAITRIKDSVTGAKDAIGGFFGGIDEAAHTVVQFFVNLPGQIMGALAALPGQLSSLFTDSMNQIGYIIGFGLATALQLFTEFPGKAYDAIVTIIQVVTSIFTTARRNAQSTVSGMIGTVVGYLATLPQRAGNAIVTLPGRILGVLRGIAKQAYDAGANIIRGVVNGMKDLFGWAVDRAKDFAHSIVDGFKDALHIGSPSQVMADEVGRWIPAGIVEGMKSGAKATQQALTATVNPLVSAAQELLQRVTSGGRFWEDLSAAGGSANLSAQNDTLADIIYGKYLPKGFDFGPAGTREAVTDALTRFLADQGAGATSDGGSGQTITFGESAIQIVFQGAVPTEQEAFQTGRAIGQGIASTLARRGVRTAVRTA